MSTQTPIEFIETLDMDLARAQVVAREIQNKALAVNIDDLASVADGLDVIEALADILARRFDEIHTEVNALWLSSMDAAEAAKGA
ncbi:MAG: hypothetical protein Q9M48_02850 [Rhodobacterales bacterium]|nr:hypothetical protein [Rhodobacterales bacterium]